MPAGIEVVKDIFSLLKILETKPDINQAKEKNKSIVPRLFLNFAEAVL